MNLGTLKKQKKTDRKTGGERELVKQENSLTPGGVAKALPGTSNAVSLILFLFFKSFIGGSSLPPNTPNTGHIPIL